MRAIFKYALDITDTQEVVMPLGAQLLCVQVQVQAQLQRPCVWALIDTIAPMVRHRFLIRGTGHSADGLDKAQYLSTFQLHGELVFHVFDGGEAIDR